MPIQCFPYFDASKQIVKKLYSFATLVTVLSALGSCGGGGGGIGDLVAQADPVVASVTVSPDTWTADRGQQQQLTATAFNVSGYPIPGVQFTWESSATEVALVDTDGSVTVLFLGGSTDITATADGKVGSAIVTVEPVASIEVSPDTWNANRIGQRQQLTATAFDAIGEPLPGVQFAWESSSTDVSKVDVNGNATAYSAGSVDITATAEGEIGTTRSTVTSEIESDANGFMYTVWFARSDDAPALLVDGNLHVLSDMFCLKQTPEDHEVILDWEVCPWDAEYSLLDYKLSRDDPDTSVNDKLGSYPNYPNPPNATTPWEYPEVEKFQWFGDRIGILSDLAEGGLGTFRVLDRHEEWRTLAIGNVSNFQLDQDRLGIIVENGALAVIDRDNVKNAPPYGPPQPPICRDNPLFPIGPPEICVPAVPLAWTTLESGGVHQFLLHQNYIGVLHEDGTLRIRFGIDGAWIAQESPGHGFIEFGMERVVKFEERCIDKFPLPPICAEVPIGTVIRVGALLDNGDFVVKDGLDGEWSLPETDIQQFQLAGSHIGLLGKDGSLRAKRGIDGAWVIDIHNVKEFGLERLNLIDVRIGAVLYKGDFLIKDGINGEWKTVASGVRQMQLQETLIGALFEDDTFGIWDAVHERFRKAALGAGAADNVTQFRVVVDVPVPPARTTTNCGNDRVDCQHRRLEVCLSQQKGCFPTRTPFERCGGLLQPPCTGDGVILEGPTSYYGRFAGSKLPSNRFTGDPKPGTKLQDWWWAVNPDEGGGPMDPMDALTMHHDAAYQCPCSSSGFLTPTVNWYPENTGDLGGDTLGAKLCVVRYGLENAKLTRDGVNINISTSTKADWGGLGQLYDVIYTDDFLDGLNQSYWTGTAEGCPTIKNPITGEIISSGVAKFIAATKAKHNN